MAKKKKRNPFAAINRAREAAKRKRTTKTTRRKAQPKKAKRRKTMAKKKRSAPRRRSSGGRKAAAMQVAQSVMLGVGGAVGGSIISRALSGTLPNPTLRGGAVAILGILGATMLGSTMLPVAIGVGISGGLTVARNLLPGITGLGDEPALAQLSAAEVDELERALIEGGVGADEHYQESLIGYDDRNAPLVGGDDGIAIDAQYQEEFAGE